LVALFPSIYLQNRLADFGADSPRRLFYRCFPNSLTGSAFRRLFCCRPLSLLLFFLAVFVARAVLATSFLAADFFTFFAFLAAGFFSIFAVFAFVVFFGFTGIDPQFDDF
jgi:hypothetical protein